MKKLFSLFLCLIMSFGVLFIGACGNDHSTKFPESVIDIYNTTYNFELCDVELNKTTKQTQVKIDYRNFLFDDTPTFNVEIAKMAIIAIEEVMFKYDNEHINMYGDFEIKDKSIKFPNLTKLGLLNIELYTMTHEEYLTDTNDLCEAVIGSVNVKDKDGKKTKVIFVALNPYIDTTGWSSDLDVGADTESYTYLTGNHPDWGNKNHHKGFDVSANRTYPFIMDYISKYSEKDAENLVFVTGQSRGASIANLLGKKLTDNGIKNLIYAFNPANTTTDLGSDLNKYKTLFSIISKDDLVSLLPLNSWNDFNVYGNKLYFKISDDVSSWEDFTGQTYKYIGDKLPVLVSLLNEITDSRENIYEFGSVRISDSDYFTTTSETSANKKKEEILSSFREGSISKNSIKVEIEHTGAVYKVKYYYRPSLMCALIDDLIQEFDYNKIIPYLTFLKGYINDLSFVISMGIKGDIIAFENPHVLKTDLVGINFLTK